MSKRSSRKNGPTGQPVTPFDLDDGNGADGADDTSQYTGRYIVLLREGAQENAARALQDRTGLSMLSASGDMQETSDAIESGNVVFPEIGAAVLELAPDQVSLLGVADASDDMIEAVEPERRVYAIQELERTGADRDLTQFNPFFDETTQDLEVELPFSMETGALGGFTTAAPAPQLSAEYLRGYRDSVSQLVDRLMEASGAEAPALPQQVEVEAWNETLATWGLQATNVLRSRYSGRGIRVAVLDTGFGPHQDFGGRTMHLRSFVPGQAPADGHGHGTHCIGTSCGPRRPRSGPRYGIAYEAEILAGKVLSNAGSGQDAWILAGINWAVAARTRVISMSLGAPTSPGQAFSAVYEGVARRALARGTMIVAAAGNDSNRPGTIRPVSHPANCPSILAVGALDPTLHVSYFSNGGLNPNGGEVNIAAPGRNVISSWPLPPFYRSLSGTSMATPHVAGIAALFAQASGTSGVALWRIMARYARHLLISRRDVGVGLVRAR